MAERHRGYEALADTRLLPGIPLAVRVEGRSFARLCRSLPQPYCSNLGFAMERTLAALVRQMEGAVFGFQGSDEIVVVLRPKQTGWLGNRSQCLASVASSLATVELAQIVTAEDLPLAAPPTFSAQVTALPSLAEAVNYLIWRQNEVLSDAVLRLAKKAVGSQEPVVSRTESEREDMIEKAGLHMEDYPSAFSRGVAAYRAPILIENAHGRVEKVKWVVDQSLGFFAETKPFVEAVLRTGQDIFRGPPSANL